MGSMIGRGAVFKAAALLLPLVLVVGCSAEDDGSEGTASPP